MTDTRKNIYKDLLDALKMATDYINKDLGNDETVSTHYGFLDCDIHFLEETIGRADHYDMESSCMDCGEVVRYSEIDIHVDESGRHIGCPVCGSTFDVN